VGVAGGKGPLRWVAKDMQVAGDREEELLPLADGELDVTHALRIK